MSCIIFFIILKKNKLFTDKLSITAKKEDVTDVLTIDYAAAKTNVLTRLYKLNIMNVYS